MTLAKPTTIENVYRGLTDKQIMEFCPAVFADDKYKECSKDYTVIPTGTVLTRLREEGFVVVTAMQARAKNEDKFSHTNHLLRLRKSEDLGRDFINKVEVPEVIINNSTDRSRAWQFFLGLCRSFCLNGLVVGDPAGTMRIYHRGGDDTVTKVVEGSLRIIGESEKHLDVLKEMKRFRLTEEEQIFFIKQAMSLRFGTDEEGKEAKKKFVPYDPKSMLTARRLQDSEPTICNTMNIGQEKLIKGARVQDTFGEWHKMQAVRSVTKNLSLNRAIWNLATAALDIKKQGKNLLDVKELVKK